MKDLEELNIYYQYVGYAQQFKEKCKCNRDRNERY